MEVNLQIWPLTEEDLARQGSVGRNYFSNIQYSKKYSSSCKPTGFVLCTEETVVSKKTLFLALMALTVQANRRKSASISLEGRMSLTGPWYHDAVLRGLPKVAFFLLSSARGLWVGTEQHLSQRGNGDQLLKSDSLPMD